MAGRRERADRAGSDRGAGTPLGWSVERLARRAAVRRAALAVAAVGAAPVTGDARAGAQGATPAGTPVAAGEPITIGCPFNLTGAQAAVDSAARDGAELAAAELSRQAGALGRPLQLRVYDGRSDPAEVAAVTRRLVEEDGVPALAGLTDPAAFLAAGPIAQEAGVPFLDVGVATPLVTDIGDYVFMVPGADTVQAAAAAEWCLGQGHTTCAVLFDESSDRAKALREYFQARFETDDAGEVVESVGFGGEDADFAEPIGKIGALETPAALLYVAAGPNQAGALVAQIRAAGLTQPIVGGDGFDGPALVQAAGEAAEEVVFVTHAGVHGDAPETVAFRDAFAAQFGKPPPSAFAALGYDAIRLLADAINRAGQPEGEAIRDALAATTGFQGLTGPVSYTAEQRIPLKPMAVVQITGGVPTLLATVTPTEVPEV